MRQPDDTTAHQVIVFRVSKQLRGIPYLKLAQLPLQSLVASL